MTSQHCSFCDREATYFLVSDRDSRHAVDHACDEHATAYLHLYRRAVPMPHDAVVDVREIDLVRSEERATVEDRG